MAKREGYLIVFTAWIALCLFGAIPYQFSGLDICFSDALFESTSGFTTTGASIFSDIESLPSAILLWRSLSQWIGGMGIIVFTVAIFPILGIGGVELFVAEAPGPTNQKLHPRIKEVAKRLWFIYFGLTLITFCLLVSIGGMTFFDSVNHALTTMSTGGFSTKNNSIASFNSPTIEYIISIFMLIGGINYSLLYFLFKGKFKKAWASEELRFYLALVFTLIIVCSTILFFTFNSNFEESFRQITFQIISIITTTGFVTADYTAWGNPAIILFFMLLFTGACAGSTSGGIKMIRHVVFLKNSMLEFKRILHPRAYVRLKMDEQVVAGSTITHILVFLLFYLITFIIGTIIMSFFMHSYSQPFLSSIGTVATCLGNVGPAIGNFGPIDNFASLAGFPKIVLSLIMVIGRLELFTVLLLFTTYFWKNN